MNLHQISHDFVAKFGSSNLFIMQKRTVFFISNFIFLIKWKTMITMQETALRNSSFSHGTYHKLQIHVGHIKQFREQLEDQLNDKMGLETTD